MTPDEVKTYYKTQYNFAKMTGMAHVSLGNWLKQGYVPRDSQYKLFHLTNGDLKLSDEIPKKPSQEPNLVIEAAHELKKAIVKILFAFTNKYCGYEKPCNLYPQAGYIIVDVLEALLKDAKKQIGEKTNE